MNLHHLELFYYVAKYEGIVNACRHMPYGVQQPAVSAQIKALEAELGVCLFRRRPFALTPEGLSLFNYAKPFFAGLDHVERVLQGIPASQLRIAGPSELLCFHVPELFQELQECHPQLRLKVFERSQAAAVQLLTSGECSLAVTVKEPSLPSHLSSKLLVSIPLAIMHPGGKGRLKKVVDMLSTGVTPQQPLIAPPHNETVTRLFYKGLAHYKTRWPTQIEAIGREQIAAYVSEGFGLGLWAATPGVPIPTGTRLEILEDFEKLDIHVFWSEPLNKLEQKFLELIVARANNLRRTRSQS